MTNLNGQQLVVTAVEKNFNPFDWTELEIVNIGDSEDGRVFYSCVSKDGSFRVVIGSGELAHVAKSEHVKYDANKHLLTVKPGTLWKRGKKGLMLKAA